MDLSQYVSQLREDLAAAAAAGDEQTRQTAALLGAAVEPAARLAIMNALADLAAEVTAALGDRVVEVRLDGRDIRVAVTGEPAAEPEPEPEPEPAAPGRSAGSAGPTAATSAGSPCAWSSRSRARPSRPPRPRACRSTRGWPRPCRARWPAAGRTARAAGGLAGRPGRPPAARLGGGMSEMVDLSKDDWPDDGEPELVRQQSWPADGPAELELSVDVGRIRVQLDEQVGDGGRAGGAGRGAARPVRRRHLEPGPQRAAELAGRAAGRRGAVGDLDQLAAQAVRATEISWSETGRRLVVRSPVRAAAAGGPAGGHGVGAARVPAGRARRRRRRPGDRDRGLDRGAHRLRRGRGGRRRRRGRRDHRLRRRRARPDQPGAARVRTGSGAVTVARAGGPTEIKASSGDVTVREVAARPGRAHRLRRGDRGRRPRPAAST